MQHNAEEQQYDSGNDSPENIINITNELVMPCRIISILNEVVSSTPQLHDLQVRACTIIQRLEEQEFPLSASEPEQVLTDTNEPTANDPKLLELQEGFQFKQPGLIDIFNEALLANEFNDFSVADFTLAKKPTIQGEYLVLGCTISISNYKIHIDCS